MEVKEKQQEASVSQKLNMNKKTIEKLQKENIDLQKKFDATIGLQSMRDKFEGKCFKIQDGSISIQSIDFNKESLQFVMDSIVVSDSDQKGIKKNGILYIQGHPFQQQQFKDQISSEDFQKGIEKVMQIAEMFNDVVIEE